LAAAAATVVVAVETGRPTDPKSGTALPPLLVVQSLPRRTPTPPTPLVVVVVVVLNLVDIPPAHRPAIVVPALVHIPRAPTARL
jgi:hypothetical protein